VSRFNKATSIRRSTPIVSAPSPLRTQNNAPGFERDPQSELFLLAVTNFVGQDTHAEAGFARDERFKRLIQEVTQQDPAWMARFLPWLRNQAHMRTAAIVGAVEFAKAFSKIAVQAPGRDSMGIGLGRKTIDAVLQRADEPGEMIGYIGRKIPKPIKRGIADAVKRLYNERAALKYDTASHGFRFGDVLELVHAAPDAPYQVALFKHLIDRRHGRDGIPSSLTTMHNNAKLREAVTEGIYSDLLEPVYLRNAGMTWEDVLSLAGDKIAKKDLWEALIPTMGYMALLRNLRNFDQAAISDTAANAAILKLSDPEEVARSRQLPLRFLSAYSTASSLRWGWPLEQALQASLQNVPSFAGRTLVLIDSSGSMDNVFSRDGSLRRRDAAALFGLALAARCQQVDVVSFGREIKHFPTQLGESLLKSLERFKGRYFFGGGTPTRAAIEGNYRGHDRVIVLTDEQADRHNGLSVFDGVPLNKICITFNLAGYRVGHGPSGSDTRITIGGLSDQAFMLLPILEKRADGAWPF
jgi:hypothetical protein